MGEACWTGSVRRYPVISKLGSYTVELLRLYTLPESDSNTVTAAVMTKCVS
jgi:hypothetical protein